jgi:hypothetical protein
LRLVCGRQRLNPHEVPNCPPLVAGQITTFVLRLGRILGGNLRGVYLHGSLALGCFNAAGSDVDLLVVTQQPMPVVTKRRLAEAILRTSNAPRPRAVSRVRYAAGVYSDLNASCGSNFLTRGA